MRVLVTRPAREAQRWVADLQQLGIDAVGLPLLEISPAADEGSVRRAWKRMAEFHAVMFVSGNAVERYFMVRPADASCWHPGPATGEHPEIPFPRAWAPGPGTRDALLRAGVPRQSIDTPAQDSEQFDSQALWLQVGDQLASGQRVLVVRGGDAQGRGVGRDWMSEQLTRRGIAVEAVVAYTRKPPVWTPAQFELAQRGALNSSLWLFSSSEAITHLQSLLPLQAWTDARAVATHPRIAQSASDAGFGVVCLSRPTLADVVASIESIR